MTLLDRLQADYAQFPRDQSYDLYAAEVYFKDPMTEFRGIERYRQMIGFIEQWFLDIDLALHEITQPQPDRIITRWTLSFTAPVPWKPRMAIPGWSELTINEQGLIVSHIDRWDCSRWAVVQQLWRQR
jgi:hypothetical protein